MDALRYRNLLDPVSDLALDESANIDSFIHV
jgi:hypothetical protein